MAAPTKIKLNKEASALEITWDSGRTIKYPLQFLRDESPDAGNKGETILWKHYAPPPRPKLTAEAYEIAAIETIGNYAIKIRWKDGYDYGIYSYELLERWIDYLEVRENLHQDFEHNHDEEEK